MAPLWIGAGFIFLISWERSACGIASVFLGASISTPFVANVKLPMIYVVDDVQIIMIKRVYGLSGCHREGLVFIVHPEFLLDVGSAQGVQTQAR